MFTRLATAEFDKQNLRNEKNDLRRFFVNECPSELIDKGVRYVKKVLWFGHIVISIGICNIALLCFPLYHGNCLENNVFRFGKISDDARLERFV